MSMMDPFEDAASLEDPQTTSFMDDPSHATLHVAVNDLLRELNMWAVEHMGSMVPLGAIVDYHGDPNNLPDAWAICDGTNGTPDLRDRFTVGAGGQYSLNASGGSNTVTLSTAQIPAHAHGSGSLETNLGGGHRHTVDSKRLTVNQGHSHDTSATRLARGATGTPNGTHVNETLSNAVNWENSHTHSVSGATANAGSGQAHENRPPYYALYKVKRIM